MERKEDFSNLKCNISLNISRFMSVAYAWKVYRNCGIMLSVSSIALGGAVVVLVSGVGGKSYPGLMIYAAATYTFYKLIMAVRNMILAGKEKSLLLMTFRNISYADALKSANKKGE